MLALGSERVISEYSSCLFSDLPHTWAKPCIVQCSELHKVHEGIEEKFVLRNFDRNQVVRDTLHSAKS